MYGPVGAFPAGALPSWFDVDLERQEREIAGREKVRISQEEEEDEELLLLAVSLEEGGEYE